MGKIFPVLLALIGLGAGIGGGLALRPAHESDVLASECTCDCGTLPADHTPAASDLEDTDTDQDTPTSDFVKMNNQFVIPVVREGSVGALVVLSLSLEIVPGQSEGIYQREPKLRDSFLQVLFDHANSGGFDGAFTSGPKLKSLRLALVEVARQQLGRNVRDVLITDIARQDV